MRLIVQRIISALEVGQLEEPTQIGNRRYHAERNIRKALHSTPEKDCQFLSNLDLYNWESVLHGNSGFGEWATRTANYGYNAYHFA